jgi:hypothetical protein
VNAELKSANSSPLLRVSFAGVGASPKAVSKSPKSPPLCFVGVSLARGSKSSVGEAPENRSSRKALEFWPFEVFLVLRLVFAGLVCCHEKDDTI